MKIRRDYVQKQKTFLSRWYQVNTYPALAGRWDVLMKICRQKKSEANETLDLARVGIFDSEGEKKRKEKKKPPPRNQGPYECLVYKFRNTLLPALAWSVIYVEYNVLVMYCTKGAKVQISRWRLLVVADHSFSLAYLLSVAIIQVCVWQP